MGHRKKVGRFLAVGVLAAGLIGAFVLNGNAAVTMETATKRPP